MSRRGRHRSKYPGTSGRATPKGTRPTHAASNRSRAPSDLMDDVARMLASDHPYDLIMGASTLVEVIRRRPSDSLARRRRDGPSATDMVDSFVGVDCPETSGLLKAFVLLLDDDLLVARARRELGRRSHALPSWLRNLEDFTIAGVWEMCDPLGDGDNHIVGLRFASGHDLTAVIYVDHNMGTLVKDAFLIPAPGDEVIARFRELSEGVTDISPLPAANARQRFVEAIARWEMTVPPLQTETWPGCRAAVEWIVKALPAGGTGYERAEWTDAQRRDIAVRFFSSEMGAPLAARREHHDLVDHLMWFACDYGPGDPLRWSPVSVEIVSQWVPAKIIAPVDELEPLPDVLRAFVRFAHSERGIGADLTAETLESIDRHEPEYRRLIRAPQAISMREAAVRAAEELFDDRPYEQIVLDELAFEVGGADILATLDAKSLPDEPFDWSGIDEDLRDRLETILDLIDRCCGAVLDVEYRTCSRRLLARAARSDPPAFRRRGRDETTAAAVVWLAGKINHLFEPGGMLVKDLLGWFGIQQGSVSQRAGTIRKAAALPDDQGWSYAVTAGDVSLLHSRRRRAIIARRDRVLAGGY